MKKMSLMLMLLAGLTGVGMAQAPPPGKKTVTINTPGVYCDQCKTIIENYMSHEDGILKFTVDVKKKQATVTFMPDRTNIEDIKTDIANCGFDADDITAEPDSYKRLPPCCKKPDSTSVPKP
jgi:copper chaperone CopZ